MRPRRPVSSLLVLVLAAASPASCDRAPQDPSAPRVSTADVHNFVSAYHTMLTTDSACAPLDGYFRDATAGLRAYRRKFDVGRKELCTAIRKSPKRYAAIESKLGALDSVAAQVGAMLAGFSSIKPGGGLPRVFFVVGDGISAGTTTHGSDAMILIGMELNRSLDGLPPTIAHEFVHTQQDFPWMGTLTGGPAFLRGTVLRHSIMEGSANLLTQVLTGRQNRNEYAEAHEAELWRDFQRDMHGKDYSRWLYNGANVRARGDRPPDLGYWMGYRITQAYYDKAEDKKQAIREILAIRDFDRFLAASGYAGPVAVPNGQD